LKAVSWFLTGLFALALAWSVSQMPLPGDPTVPLSVHVSTRYASQAGTETGFKNPLFAVMGDYRSFDLILLALMAAGACLLRWGSAREQDSRLPPVRNLFFILSFLGFLALLALGSFSLYEGSRFLDYECWAQFASPVKARVLGATWALGLASLVYIFLFLIRSKGKP
jgi:hypothetical protein